MRGLMYHHFGLGRYGVEREDFRAHCQFMAEHPSTFTATFDDGMADAFLAAGDLEEAKLRGRFFITTSWIGKPGFLNLEQIRALHERGHVIGLHGHTHCFLRGLGIRQLREELLPGMDLLRQALGKGVEEASMPGGRFDDATLHVMTDLGIRQAWTSEPGHWGGTFGSLERRGRDRVPRGGGASFLRGLGRGDALRSLAYGLKSIPKGLLGDRLYHKMTREVDPGGAAVPGA